MAVRLINLRNSHLKSKIVFYIKIKSVIDLLPLLPKSFFLLDFEHQIFFIFFIFLSPLLSLDRVRGPKVAETGSGVTESGLIDATQVLRPIRPDREAGRNPGRLRSRGPGLKKQR